MGNRLDPDGDSSDAPVTMKSFVYCSAWLLVLWLGACGSDPPVVSSASATTDLGSAKPVITDRDVVSDVDSESTPERDGWVEQPDMTRIEELPPANDVMVADQEPGDDVTLVDDTAAP